ncbi:MAG: hypothetical protein DHS20C01_23790 [marine bacterium B5-7]|nr:MAG: hypothetical protein DHS20C01_23790 [marine bacterium B5-7]
MAVTRFKTQHFLIRFGLALVLVFATYNPLGLLSYYHWALAPLFGGADGASFDVFKALVGLILIVGWTIFIRSTQRSLGAFGLALATAFFVLLFWLFFDRGWLSLDNPDVITWLVLIAIAGIMALGMSWSHIRRRLSGQLDVDDVEEHDS